MCGITVSVIQNQDATQCSREVWDTLCISNAKRGPDWSATHTVTHHNGTILTFAASVLHMRGDHPTRQPHVSAAGDVLCWNGEIFDGLQIGSTDNDGTLLFGSLTSTESSLEVVDALSRIEGPYALVYYSAHEDAVYFARDPLGRRSLLHRGNTDRQTAFMLSSTSAGALTSDFDEVSTEFIFRLPIATIYHHIITSRWHCQGDLEALPRIGQDPDSFVTSLLLNTTVPPPQDPLGSHDMLPAELSAAIGHLIEHLDRSVHLRVQHVPRLPREMTPGVSTTARIGILFSGGLDSTILARLADRHVPQDEPIDLLNVAFENPRKLQAQIRFKSQGKGKGKKTSISLEVPSSTSAYDAPDRLTGREEVEELRRLSPHRQWNFVEVNVPYGETQATRPTVEQLMHPSKSVMDLSLALALYFASRGRGSIRNGEGISEPYQSNARVLLSGLGADELLGGYSRHKKAFYTTDWIGLIAELQLDLTRLPTRNLGRDDRIISSHGKESRYPFLSLGVVAFLAALPVHVKLDPRLGDGLGDKMLLRLAAKELGLVEASSRRKRAMQFGSQSARMEEGSSRRGDQTLDVTATEP
ncbi:asparagine synthase-domain-containing protein [Auriculariales sp. MPI-PUGE-AT-0066]|nr:asparagine synthase-domain-containing protein [Auriculariales sp. MPI-PUGE-AT-0066]